MRLTVVFGAITATVGMALIFLSLAAGTGVPADRQGIASGSINVSRVTGGALGLSVIAVIAASPPRRPTGTSTQA
ncbi:hypothetical protein AB0K18_38085 [Nonomuraea sp. NPDC049421]|uniref:hypothetical protein n=1 Tax=Nonomuraea sp. NPDC049421 TaxID=3155275 RepID=UPI00342216F9